MKINMTLFREVVKTLVGVATVAVYLVMVYTGRIDPDTFATTAIALIGAYFALDGALFRGAERRQNGNGSTPK